MRGFCRDCQKDVSLAVYNDKVQPVLYTCEECGQFTESYYWGCKYCGENEEPKCHKCVREDGKSVTDELVD